MFLQNWYPRETSLLFTGRQMLCSMSVRKCKLEKSRQHNGQKKKYKRTNNNQTMSCQKTLETTERKLTAINCNKNNLILISLFDWITVS